MDIGQLTRRLANRIKDKSERAIRVIKGLPDYLEVSATASPSDYSLEEGESPETVLSLEQLTGQEQKGQYLSGNRREFLKQGSRLGLGGVAWYVLGGCATTLPQLTASDNPVVVAGPTVLRRTAQTNEFAFYERLKSLPRGEKIPITEFPEIMNAVGKYFLDILFDAHEHKPPIGIDYRVSPVFPWTPIVAPAKGTVNRAKFHQDSGNYVVIAHGAHYTIHAHCQPLLLVQKGDVVERGRIICFGGNTGYNARGVHHYHIGTTEPTFNPDSEKPIDWVKVNNPHTYAEKGSRLGTWHGNDIDSEYRAAFMETVYYTNNIISRLPKHLLGNITKDPYMGIKLGVLNNLSIKGILSSYIDEPKEITDKKLRRYMDIKPTYTLFINPSKPELYHIIVTDEIVGRIAEIIQKAA